MAQPWCDKECDCHERYGKFGQMMPQNEFLLLMQACDVFDLVELRPNSWLPTGRRWPPTPSWSRACWTV